MTSQLPPHQTPLPTDAPSQVRHPLLALAGWIALTLGLGVGVGLLFGPDAWFTALLKPTWNPPGWLFAPVWTLLYILMGVSVWIVRSQPDVPRALVAQAMRLFWLQLALNLLWTPIFFGLHRPWLAFAEICLLWIAVLYTALMFGRIRAIAGYLMIPYGLWVSFALVLNGTIWLMNT